MSQFIPDDFCAYIERYKITMSFVVPPILVVLANHPGELAFAIHIEFVYMEN
jgi:hypothetical protein